MKRLEKFAGLAALIALAVLALLFLPSAAVGQDKDKDHGSIELGVRFAGGDVYGRPDLQSGNCLGCGTPFDPALKNSKFNEYRDVRNGVYIRRLDVRFENVLDSKNYLSLQSQRTLYRDQSYLGTFGQHGKFKLQFRYDEIPHTYSATTRTLFTQTAPGVWSYPFLLRQTLQATAGASLPNVINTQLVQQFNFITPSIVRRAGTALFSYNVNENWTLNGSFWRENERGTRPIGSIMNSGPSASVTGGYGVELPESINYYNNLVRVGTDYGRKTWAVQAAYTGSFLQNDTGSLTWDNPFRTTDCLNAVTPLLCSTAQQGPATGRIDLYPNNQAHYVSVAGAVDLTKYLHLTASVTPGWLRQNDAFLPYSTNTALTTCGDGTQACTSLATLPEASLNGNKQTLAMNYTLVTTAWKKVELKANYRHYDYNNNNPVRTFTPVEGDSSVSAARENVVRGYNRKNLELTGEWYFANKSDLKVGYEAEWMDRSNRDARHSLENSIFTAVDWVPIRDLLIRASYRHSDRKPDTYVDEAAEEISGAIPVDSPFARRFDESARLRDRGDGLVQYSPTDKLTLSAFAGTVQDDYNRAGGSNSATPLNFLTGAAATTKPYYLYGVLKDLSYNYGFGADYAVTTQVSFFAEYSHEKYHKRIISRNRSPESTSGTGGCGPNSFGTANQGACDTANNDWESTSRELVDITSAGVDLYLGKKAYLTTYYSLSAVKGNVDSRYLGDPINHPNSPLANDPNRFMLVGTNAAVDYPETVNRNHEVAVIFKYKLSEHLMPRVEYRYQQWDNKDYQTSLMTQYMGCVSPLTGAAVAGCTTRMLTQVNANDPSPVGVPSQYYPYFVVGDTSAARYLFLGVDQPSYRAHTVIATLEYSF